MARAVRKMTEELVQASINFGYWWGHMGATPSQDIKARSAP
jgi:hypothetical protein